MPIPPFTSADRTASSLVLAGVGVAIALVTAWGRTLGAPSELLAEGFGESIDTDNDGLDDTFELILGTSPFEIDTDFDLFTDSEEIARHSDPRDAGSFPLANALSIGQSAFVAGDEFRLVTLIYVPYAIANWSAMDLRLGLHTSAGTIELPPDIYAPFTTLTIVPTAMPGSIGLRLESSVPVATFAYVTNFAFIATITDQVGSAPKGAAATNLAWIAGVLAVVEPTSSSVVAPRNYSPNPGSGPLLSVRPIVVAEDVPPAFTSGEICLQSTTEVGYVDGVVELLVDSSNCEPADAYCAPTCAFEAGTTKEIVDPLALIGG
jgi:hypothetical protein